MRWCTRSSMNLETQTLDCPTHATPVQAPKIYLISSTSLAMVRDSIILLSVCSETDSWSRTLNQHEPKSSARTTSSTTSPSPERTRYRQLSTSEQRGDDCSLRLKQALSVCYELYLYVTMYELIFHEVTQRCILVSTKGVLRSYYLLVKLPPPI